MEVNEEPTAGQPLLRLTTIILPRKLLAAPLQIISFRAYGLNLKSFSAVR